MNTAAATIPSFESTYRTHFGLLLGVFTRLANEGFVAQPTDAADIVHDFFLEEWQAISRNFDPARATAFSTYLYAAFVRFARARVQRLHRQRGLLLPPEDLLALQDSVAAAPSPEQSLDLVHVTAALARLAPTQRRLVEKWLVQQPYSERKLAREMGTSRYKLREQLVEAIGLVSLHFASPASKESLDHLVAQAIWQDKLTPAEAAAALGIGEPQVRSARERNYRRIVQALINTPAPVGRSRIMTMSENSLHALMARIFSDAPIEQVELEVERQAPALVHYLADADEAAENRWRELPDDRLGRLYSAVARGMNPTADVNAPAIDENDAFYALHQKDRRAVGIAFADALVPALPNELSRLLRACERNLPRASRKVREGLLRVADVISGGGAARELAEFGLTPTHLVFAAAGVSMLIERAANIGYLPEGQKLVFMRKRTEHRDVAPAVQSLTHESSGASFSRAELAQELCHMTEMEAPVGEVLLDWLVDSAPYVRCCFNGFAAETARENVVLRPIPESAEGSDLYMRWTSPHLAHRERAAAY